MAAAERGQPPAATMAAAMARAPDPGAPIADRDRRPRRLPVAQGRADHRRPPNTSGNVRGRARRWRCRERECDHRPAPVRRPTSGPTSRDAHPPRPWTRGIAMRQRRRRDRHSRWHTREGPRMPPGEDPPWLHRQRRRLWPRVHRRGRRIARRRRGTATTPAGAPPGHAGGGRRHRLPTVPPGGRGRGRSVRRRAQLGPARESSKTRRPH